MFAYSDHCAFLRPATTLLAKLALAIFIVGGHDPAVAQNVVPSTAAAAKRIDPRALVSPSTMTAEGHHARSKKTRSKKIGLTLSPSLRLPVSPILSSVAGDGQSSGSRSSDDGAVLALTATYVPVQHWLIQASVYHYLNRAKRRPWDADFSYGFGYVDYRPHTFSLMYSNYSTNRFSPEPGQAVTRIGRGTLTGSWSFEAPKQIQLDPAQRTSCRLGYNVQPGFGAGATARRWRQAASVGCSYPLWKSLYVAATGYVYPHGEKDPSNPDFTYSFGWADWRPGGFSVQYSNYAGNRFPWDKSKGSGGFKRGTISIGWGAAF